MLQCNGHKSTYDMSENELAEMTLNHVKERHRTTEFSSWSASLSTAMSFTKSKTRSIISIIDTKLIWNDVEVFYVPDLDFLNPGQMNYNEEYLAHGIINSENHRSFPYRGFLDAGFVLGGISTPLQGPSAPIGVTEDLVLRARCLGEQYGPNFALPMTLAVISRSLVAGNTSTDESVVQKLQDMPRELPLIEDATMGLIIRGPWDDEGILKDNTVHVRGWPEIRQLILLMRHYAKHVGKKNIDKMIRGKFVRVQEVSRSRRSRRGAHQGQTPEQEHDELERKLKGLRARLTRELGIDMNRYGQASGGNEVGIQQHLEGLSLH